MKTILASVYAVNPYKGSEDGTGWQLILQIARFNKVIAVTRENNRPFIDRYFREHDVPGSGNIRFEYFDLPYWLRFWKRGGKNALLYYYLWQLALPVFVRRKRLCFDIAHNLNFHADWTPSFLWRLKRPFVWGPAGHHPSIPRSFIEPVYGRKRWLLDRLRWLAKLFFWRMDPFLQVTKKKAFRIIAINSDVNKQLKVNPDRIVLMPAVATEDMAINADDMGRTADNTGAAAEIRGATAETRGATAETRGSTATPDKGFTVISVGRFVALKGFDITIRAFSAFLKRLTPAERDGVKLVLVGDGPELGFLRSICLDEGLESRVEIIAWVQRDAIAVLYAGSTLFLFPSHEGAGMVVPEALCCGLPVLCFDNAGPGEFINEACGIKIPYGTYELAVEHFADALERLYRDPLELERLQAGARQQFLDRFQWDQKGEILKRIYDEIA